MPSLVRHPSSVNISHLDLLENHWAELNHAWQRCSLWGPILHKFCYVLCRFVKKWSSGDIGNIVSFLIIFFQEPLKRWYGTVICMFILRSLTGLVTFWAHRKFKIVASGGQSFALKPYVMQHFHGLLGKHWTEFNHTWQRCSLLCPTQVLLLFMPIR